MTTARVTAIIPVYNCEKYIREALESVLRQTYPLHEVIVVDDGSTDGTKEAIRPHWDSITYIYQKNAGEPSARNTGARRATGEFVAFLDADDLWAPDKIRLQMEYFEAHPEYALVYTDMATFDEQGILEKSARTSRGRSYRSGWIFPNLFMETLFGSGSVVCRKACIEQVGGFDETFLIGSDYEMWLRMARHFQFGYVDQPLLLYRQHAQMSTQTAGRLPQNGIPWQAKVLNRILELYPETFNELGRTAIHRRLAIPYMWLGRTWLDRGYHLEARKLISGAVRYSPWNLRYRCAYLATFLTPRQVTGATKVYRKIREKLRLSAKVSNVSTLPARPYVSQRP